MPKARKSRCTPGLDSLRSNQVSYKDAALTDQSCAGKNVILKTTIHYFAHFDAYGQILAAKLNISFLNRASCIAEMSGICLHITVLASIERRFARIDGRVEE